MEITKTKFDSLHPLSVVKSKGRRKRVPAKRENMKDYTSNTCCPYHPGYDRGECLGLCSAPVWIEQGVFYDRFLVYFVPACMFFRSGMIYIVSTLCSLHGLPAQRENRD
jgi:hypothetical protein